MSLAGPVANQVGQSASSLLNSAKSLGVKAESVLEGTTGQALSAVYGSQAHPVASVAKQVRGSATTLVLVTYVTAGLAVVVFASGAYNAASAILTAKRTCIFQGQSNCTPPPSGY